MWNWLGLTLQPVHDNTEKSPKQFKPRDRRGVVCNTLGDQRSRADRILAAVTALGVKLSSVQEQLLISIMHNAVIDSFAGSGKSLLQEIMMYMTVHSEFPPLVFFASESNFMVRDMYQRCSWLPKERKLLLSTEDVGSHVEDHRFKR